MREYDMPIEEQVKLLVREFHGLKDSIETKFDSIDKKLESLDARLQKTDATVETIDGLLKSTHDMVTRNYVLLEDTRAVAKLGLEGVQGLQESTDEKFAAAAKANAEQTDMLKSLIVHVRKRVERVEPRKRRRRT
jgi:hypothetical protein